MKAILEPAKAKSSASNVPAKIKEIQFRHPKMENTLQLLHYTAARWKKIRSRDFFHSNGLLWYVV